jgi:tRNA (Thr-GGU) A37 N-methylase
MATKSNAVPSLNKTPVTDIKEAQKTIDTATDQETHVLKSGQFIVDYASIDLMPPLVKSMLERKKRKKARHK